MINAPPLHATRPLGRALLTLGTLAASYYIVWLACSPFLPNHPALASFFPSPTTAVSLAHAAGGAIAVGTLAYCGAVMVGAAVLKDTPGYVPPALQAGRGTKKRE